LVGSGGGIVTVDPTDKYYLLYELT